MWDFTLNRPGTQSATKSCQWNSVQHCKAAFSCILQFRDVDKIEVAIDKNWLKTTKHFSLFFGQI